MRNRRIRHKEYSDSKKKEERSDRLQGDDTNADDT